MVCQSFRWISENETQLKFGQFFYAPIFDISMKLRDLVLIYTIRSNTIIIYIKYKNSFR